MAVDPKPEDWAVLGVVAGACTRAEARAAYLARASALHPDRHPDVVGEARDRLDRAMGALNAAWDRIEAWSGWDEPEPPGGPRPDAGSRPFVEQDRPLPPAPPGFRIVRGYGLGHLGESLQLVGKSRDLLRLVDDPGTPWRRLRCTNRRLDEDHLAAALAVLRGLRTLDLDGTGVTDRTAELLPEQEPGLVDLHLSDTGITDEGLRAVARLRRLHVLSLAGTNVTDAGIAHLAGHPSLAVLNLRATRVKGPGLPALAECPELHLLALPRVRRADREALAGRRPDITFT